MKPYKTKGVQNHKTSSMTTRFRNQKASLNSCKSKVIEILLSIVEVTTVWSFKIRICKKKKIIDLLGQNLETWTLPKFQTNNVLEVMMITKSFRISFLTRLKVYLQNCFSDSQTWVTWVAPKTDCLIHLKTKEHFVMTWKLTKI